jgi:hypothetical protein
MTNYCKPQGIINSLDIVPKENESVSMGRDTLEGGN